MFCRLTGISFSLYQKPMWLPLSHHSWLVLFNHRISVSEWKQKLSSLSLLTFTVCKIGAVACLWSFCFSFLGIPCLYAFLIFFGGWEDKEEVRAHCENQTSLEHGTFLLSQPPNCWDSKCGATQCFKLSFKILLFRNDFKQRNVLRIKIETRHDGYRVTGLHITRLA